jgi:hypothetical protein
MLVCSRSGVQLGSLIVWSARHIAAAAISDGRYLRKPYSCSVSSHRYDDRCAVVLSQPSAQGEAAAAARERRGAGGGRRAGRRRARRGGGAAAAAVSGGGGGHRWRWRL